MSTGALSEPRLRRTHDVMAGYVEYGELPGAARCRPTRVSIKAIGQTVVIRCVYYRRRD